MKRLTDIILDYALISEFDINELKKYQCIPIKQDELYIYFYTSSNIDCSLIFNKVSKTENASLEEILFFLSHARIGLTLQQLYMNSLDEEHNQDSIIKLLYEVLSLALDQRSSDVHFECLEKSLMIRFRIDGVLRVFFQFERNLYAMISSLIKLKCNLDITQVRLALNGRFSEVIKDKKVDFRVSTLPTIHGESIVLRILEEKFEFQKLTDLGFNQYQYKQLAQNIQRSQGLILITGPTGSGKTTTLYSILHELNNESKKIITIEDPIEYQMKNIQQVAVKEDIGLGFNDILKHVLRQDPDIIMIGEIRDETSLQIALQASLTGHLVLSTLHTNSALETLNRLYDLKAKPYILSSALKMVISQRLVLKLCGCINGCELCHHSTYKGRVCISEMLTVDEKMSKMINDKESQIELMKHLCDRGFKSIEEDGLEKCEQSIIDKKQLFLILGDLDEKV